MERNVLKNVIIIMYLIMITKVIMILYVIQVNNVISIFSSINMDIDIITITIK